MVKLPITEVRRAQSRTGDSVICPVAEGCSGDDRQQTFAARCAAHYGDAHRTFVELTRLCTVTQILMDATQCPSVIVGAVIQVCRVYDGAHKTGTTLIVRVVKNKAGGGLRR